MNDDIGRVVIVTGAGKGLGAAFARAWGREGARVVVNNRTRAGEPSSAEAVAAEIRAAGGDAVADTHAVDAPGAADAILRAALDAYGRVDAVILNAGITGPAAKLGAMEEADLRTVMEINFFATAAMAQAALPHLEASPAGRLLFVSSAAGLHGVRGRSPYAASKGAVNAFALTIADEMRRSTVRTNVICPYAATAMTVADGEPSDPLMAPDNAAAMALYLTSAACDLNGQILMAGGRRFRRARVMEAPGASAPDTDPAWIAANIATIGDMADAREFVGAEAAFADLYADARRDSQKGRA